MDVAPPAAVSGIISLMGCGGVGPLVSASGATDVVSVVPLVAVTGTISLLSDSVQSPPVSVSGTTVLEEQKSLVEMSGKSSLEDDSLLESRVLFLVGPSGGWNFVSFSAEVLVSAG